MTADVRDDEGPELGFDPFGHDYRCSRIERDKLLGCTPLACSIYLRALKPFATAKGRCLIGSYYAIGQIVAIRRRYGRGRQVVEFTLKQLRTAVDELVDVELVVRGQKNEERGVLYLVLSHAFPIGLAAPARPRKPRLQ